MEQTIIEQLEEVFRRVFKDDTINITREMSAVDIEMWDSLTHMELIAEIETAANIEFSYDQVISFHNIGDMVDLLASRPNS